MDTLIENILKEAEAETAALKEAGWTQRDFAAALKQTLTEPACPKCQAFEPSHAEDFVLKGILYEEYQCHSCGNAWLVAKGGK